MQASKLFCAMVRHESGSHSPVRVNAPKMTSEKGRVGGDEKKRLNSKAATPTASSPRCRPPPRNNWPFTRRFWRNVPNVRGYSTPTLPSVKGEGGGECE